MPLFKEQATGLSIYPVPSENQINLNFFLELEQDLTLEIYNAAGKLLRLENRRAMKGQNNWKEDISALPVGAYFLRLRSEQVHLNERFIKK